MKKFVFSVLLLAFLSLSGQDNSVWISQPGWVTGPGSELYNNQLTYLLPFGFKVDAGTCWNAYVDESPVLYETDMGWPVPDESGENLKYLLFGDTHTFRRNNQGNLSNQIKNGNNVILSFNVSEPGHDAAEIPDHELSPFLSTDSNSYPMTFFCEKG